MKIATFNANSVRVRLPIILDWLAVHDVDVLAIQETKCEDAQFPLEAFEEAGYHAAFHGQKSYNGVATVSRHPIENVRKGFGDPAMPEDCRILTLETAGVTVMNTYVPNGTQVGGDKWAYKMAWLERFRPFLEQHLRQNPKTVWLGDINIAPKPEDVYDSAKVSGGVGHHPDEFSRLAAIVDVGVVDLFRKHTQGHGHFTYWEFVIPKAVERNLGWRIDHLYAPPEFADRCASCTIDRAPRLMERPSDHTFVLAEFAV